VQDTEKGNQQKKIYSFIIGAFLSAKRIKKKNKETDVEND